VGLVEVSDRAERARAGRQQIDALLRRHVLVGQQPQRSPVPVGHRRGRALFGDRPSFS